MGIRQKILIYFSSTIILLVGLSLLFVYVVSAENREEEFQQLQKEKIKTTFKFLTRIKAVDELIIEELDKQSINEFYDEKLLIFNRDKKLIYSSLDNTPITISKNVLSELSEQNQWIETKEDLYDVVGLYIENDGKPYYGISKAYDNFGYAKLNHLKLVLLFTFLGISLIIILVSFYLSRVITQPITSITGRINHYDFNSPYNPIELGQSKDEISMLAGQFNKLMQRMNNVFSFQKHAIHHISHELKTPVAVLVSNLERIEKETDPDTIKTLIRDQKEDTKSLGEIINSLLEISKTESGNELIKTRIRADEMIFDIMGELKLLYPGFNFSVDYGQLTDEHNVALPANPRLIKAMFTNIMVNSIQYNSENTTHIYLEHSPGFLNIRFENKGTVLTADEQPYLFQHFFRGKNSKIHKGFGLGLVFASKILLLHNGTITYHAVDHNNIFSVKLPLT